MTYFREVQRFRQPWLVAVLLVPLIIISYGAYRQLVLGHPWGHHPASNELIAVIWIATVLFDLWFLNLKMVTEVTERELTAQFIPMWKKRSIPLDHLGQFKMVTYNPLLDYGGWGIRRGLKGWCYNVRGNRGVQLELPNESLLIGSQQPEALAKAIRQRSGVTLHGK